MHTSQSLANNGFYLLKSFLPQIFNCERGQWISYMCSKFVIYLIFFIQCQRMVTFIIIRLYTKMYFIILRKSWLWCCSPVYITIRHQFIINFNKTQGLQYKPMKCMHVFWNLCFALVVRMTVLAWILGCIAL